MHHRTPTRVISVLARTPPLQTPHPVQVPSNDRPGGSRSLSHTPFALASHTKASIAPPVNHGELTATRTSPPATRAAGHDLRIRPCISRPDPICRPHHTSCTPADQPPHSNRVTPNLAPKEHLPDYRRQLRSIHGAQVRGVRATHSRPCDAVHDAPHRPPTLGQSRQVGTHGVGSPVWRHDCGRVSA